MRVRMQMRVWIVGLAVAASALLLTPAVSAVTIDWATVGDPGNACDSQSQGCFGSVGAVYRISTTEVTNAQYSEFLNAVAADDTNGLYSTNMDASALGGISRSGSAGSFSYAAKAGREDMPVNFVSFWDALRFANWLHNGQPTGAQGNLTTEDGAYTITPAGIGANNVVRNPGASFFLTSEDEWYKAAYYDTISTSYFNYPTGTNTQTACTVPGGGGNNANCNGAVGDFTDVGSYPGSPSPNGTFDQGGNVWEWNEAVIGGTNRGRRGGSLTAGAATLGVQTRGDSDPNTEFDNVGFRIASIPEPGTGLLVMAGLVGLARWRSRARR